MKKTARKNKKKILTGVDLFAGAGGFSLAAKKVGIRIKAAVEMNAHACSTYRRNLIKHKHKRNKTILFENDINDIDFKRMMKMSGLREQECDVLLGGPPCQGFSTHRINGEGVDDPRNSLLLRYFEFVDELRPKIFLVENVPGLLWKRHAKYLKKFLSQAKKIGYKTYGPTILNAQDFGVPQNRKRVFIVGVRNDLTLNFNWPPSQTHFAPDSPDVVQKKRKAWVPAKAVFDKPLLKNDVNDVHMNHSSEIVEVFKNTPINGGSRSDSGRVLPCHEKHNGHKDVYGRIDPEKPGPTMTTACINPSKGRFVHPIENHGITARHAARFQTFPDEFVFEGGIIASGAQIGNAVPIDLGKAVLATIAKALLTQRIQKATRSKAIKATSKNHRNKKFA
jgi:DNA (cytosine-5)-methyltransferase 1